MTRYCVLCAYTNSDHNISSICDRCTRVIPPEIYEVLNELVNLGMTRKASAMYRKWASQNDH